MKILPQKELEDMMISTGTYKEIDSQEIKDNWHKIYREVENETNKQIAEAGSVTKWYESGVGRLI